MKITFQHHLFCLSLFTLVFAACGTRGDGELLTDIRQVDNFHALEIGVNGRVEVRTDSVFRVEVTAEENVLPFLETLVDHDGTLKIFFSRDVWDVDGLHIRVSAPHWDGFNVSGSAEVDVPDVITGHTLDLALSGSGDLHVFNADFQQVKSRITGSGGITLAGVADDLNCTVSGSGDLLALDCPVKTATVTVSGSGNIRVKVSDELDATVSGSGNVEYLGNPQVSSQVSGSGRVRKI